jgi:hypothetical protein
MNDEFIHVRSVSRVAGYGVLRGSSSVRRGSAYLQHECLEISQEMQPALILALLSLSSRHIADSPRRWDRSPLIIVK